MKGHRILNLDSKKEISRTDTQRTVDRAAATQPIIDPPTLTLAKGAAVSSEAIHTNLRTIETGSQVVHNGLLIFLLAETMIGHGLHLRIDPARPPPSTVYRHGRISPLMTYGGRPGIGVETIIPATRLAIDTAQMTCRRTVTTGSKEIHGGRHMIVGRGLLRPLLLDPLEWIMLQLLLALPMMHRMACTPLHHHPQTPLLRPLRNDPCLQSVNRYPSPFLRRNRSLPSSAGPLHRLIPLRLPKTHQGLTQALQISLRDHHRSVQSARDALGRKRSWLTAVRSQDVVRFMTMTLQPSWGKERLGRNSSFDATFSALTVFPVRYTRRSRKLRERSLPLRGFLCTTRRKGCLSLLSEKSKSSKLSNTRAS